MKKCTVVVLTLSLCFLLAVVARTQEPAPAPKPGPEHEKLGYYVGKWAADGDIKPGPFGPGGKYSYTQTCDWLPGKFAILCTTQGTILGGETRSTVIMSYDTNEKVYIYFESNNWGELEYFRGTVDRDTWTWNSEFKINTKPVRARFILKQVSNDLATFTFGMTMSSGEPTPVMEGKQVRQK